MEVLVRNADGNLPDRDRDYAAKKLGGLDRYFHAASKVEIVHRQQKLSHRVEVTVHADGLFLRGEESDESLRAAIDKVADKMENRLRRLKTRIVRAHRHRGRPVPTALEEVESVEPEEHFDIREHKRFTMKPMSVEEAALQMELLGHTFFVFRNETGKGIEVLYKRAEGGYGLLTPDG